MTSTRLISLTFFAMIAFAANSVLGRFALLDGQTGPGAFALLRLTSGAIFLAFLCRAPKIWRDGSFTGGASLFIYAAFFSYAYLLLDTGAGALLLFSTVQIVMVGASLRTTGRLSKYQWGGLALAMFGFIIWLLPNANAPSLKGSILMAISGVAWSIYSLGGINSADPKRRTAGNFMWAAGFALISLPIIVYFTSEPMPSLSGITLAVISGTITSGLGYVVWYQVLPDLKAFRAGVCQLSVPVLAAIGGVMFTADKISLTFIGASILILGGVGIATLYKPSK